ncbi:hypothetical protein F3N42_06985 [Marinihelvus fidelis]|uniref:Uncharacterized protein n=2 Tax=Marinihelvus fidelis TaxID=2613842 RepID=A0A5N0TA30_9GAMM|nr:hypothetical protein F3N42_06985 [Marinihelvus fidelis]
MAHINASISDAPSPWGWSPKRSNRAVSQAYAAGKGAHHATLTTVRKGGVVPGTSGDAAEKRLERNVLTGYDLTRARPKTTETDTTSWPYRDDSFYSSSASGYKRAQDLTRSGLDRRDRDLDERPGSDGKKPWGW